MQQTRSAPRARARAAADLDSFERRDTRFRDFVDHEFGDVIGRPPSERAVAAIGAGMFVGRLDSEQIKQGIEQAGQTRSGPEADKARRRYLRELHRSTIERDPLAELPKQERQRYERAARVARTEQGWSNESIRKTVAELVVRAQGDQREAGRMFRTLIRGDRVREPGHDATQQFDEHKHARSAERADEAVGDREAKDKRVQRQVAVADRVAAATLPSGQYAAYRVLRENAHAIRLQRRGTEIGADTGNKTISDTLGVSRSAASQLIGGMRETLQKRRGAFEAALSLDGDMPRLSTAERQKRVNRRMQTPTHQIVAERNTRRQPGVEID